MKILEIGFIFVTHTHSWVRLPQIQASFFTSFWWSHKIISIWRRRRCFKVTQFSHLLLLPLSLMDYNLTYTYVWALFPLPSCHCFYPLFFFFREWISRRKAEQPHKELCWCHLWSVAWLSIDYSRCDDDDDGVIFINITNIAWIFDIRLIHPCHNHFRCLGVIKDRKSVIEIDKFWYIWHWKNLAFISRLICLS